MDCKPPMENASQAKESPPWRRIGGPKGRQIEPNLTISNHQIITGAEG